MKTVKEQIFVMQSFVEGKKIEYHSHQWSENRWEYHDSPKWDWANYDYRVKEELLQGKTKAERDTIEQAFDEGKVIECKVSFYKDDQWDVANRPAWNWLVYDYRIKPEPTYIPYTSETWKQDIERFRNMFVVGKSGKDYCKITKVYCENSETYFVIEDTHYLSSDLFEFYIWEDGAPCGTLQTNQ